MIYPCWVLIQLKNNSKLSLQEQYKVTIIISGILLLIGYGGSFLGIITNSGPSFLLLLSSGLAGTGLFALIYSIIGYYDAKKKVSQE